MGFSASPGPCCTNHGVVGLAFEFEIRRGRSGLEVPRPDWSCPVEPFEDYHKPGGDRAGLKLGESQLMVFMDFS